jgi:asparagine synthetase B (glutamine-hydrolysing)
MREQRINPAAGTSTPYPDWVVAVPRDLRRPAALQHVDENGSGPIVTRRESCLALFDGLLYNREAIEKRLGVSAATDADLLLHAYGNSRERPLHDFTGVYSLVVHDEGRAYLLAARDRVGSYPLFYADADGDLLLSTSIDLILRDERVSRELNRAALADHLAHRWPDPGETYFAAVRRVPPGHALVIDQGVQRIFRYWTPTTDGGAVSWFELTRSIGSKTSSTRPWSDSSSWARLACS